MTIYQGINTKPTKSYPDVTDPFCKTPQKYGSPLIVHSAMSCIEGLDIATDT